MRSCPVPVHAHGCLFEAVPEPSACPVQLLYPPAQAFSLACVLQVGVFNHWAQCLIGAALTLTFFQHLCYRVLWTLKAINQELWMCVKSGAKPEEWGVDPEKPWSPSLFCPVYVLLLRAFLAPSGGPVMLCTLPCFNKFLTHQR